MTDEVIRGTGLVEKVEAGVADGGLEVAGVFDGVPQDSSTDGVRRLRRRRQGRRARTRSSPWAAAR